MKLKLNRQKPRQILFSVIYRLSKLPFMSSKGKLKLFLNLNWIFWRLSGEQAVKHFGFSDDSMRRKNLKFLLSRLKPDHRILDLGCKYGDISEIIAEKTKLVVGIDHDKSAIEVAKKQQKNSNITYVNADAYDYLLDNKESFDVMILSHILEHLDTPEDFLNKFKRFFSEFYIEIPDFDDTYLNHYRKKVGTDLIYTDNDHIWEFDRDSFMELLHNCGLEIVASEYRYGLQKYWCKTVN